MAAEIASLGLVRYDVHVVEIEVFRILAENSESGGVVDRDVAQRDVPAFVDEDSGVVPLAVPERQDVADFRIASETAFPPDPHYARNRFRRPVFVPFAAQGAVAVLDDSGVDVQLHHPRHGDFPAFADEHELAVFEDVGVFRGVDAQVEIVGSDSGDLALPHQRDVPVHREIFQDRIAAIIERNGLDAVMHDELRPAAVECYSVDSFEKHRKAFGVDVRGVRLVVIAFDGMLGPEIVAAFGKVEHASGLFPAPLYGFVDERRGVDPRTGLKPQLCDPDRIAGRRRGVRRQCQKQRQ